MSYFNQTLDPIKKIFPNLLREQSSARTLQFNCFQTLEWPEEFVERELAGNEVYTTVKAEYQRISSEQIEFLEEDLLSITLKFSSLEEAPSYELNILMELNGKVYMCLESYIDLDNPKTKYQDLVLTTIGFGPENADGMKTLTEQALQMLKNEHGDEINSTTAVQLPLDDYPVLSARLQKTLEDSSKGKASPEREY